MTNVEANILGRRPLSLFLATVLIMAVISVTADGQSKEANPVLSNVRVGAPGIFLQQAEALGLRLNTPGKERTVYSGQLFDQDGKSSPARVIHQMPGLVRLEGFKDGGASLSFDGRQAIGITNRKSDESLIETFLADFPEGLFASVQNGAAVRLIGRGFGPDPLLQPDYKGIRYDIYDIADKVRCRQDQLTRSKLYYFDSRTGLLQSVRYYDRSVSPPIKMETRFSEWGYIDGSAYPALVEHYEDGKLVFTFIAEQIEGGASIDKTNFE